MGRQSRWAEQLSAPAALRFPARASGRGGRLRVVVGDYGTGKTHMLECARDAALARNHAVAVATLDSREATPARPRRVYRALIRGRLAETRLREVEDYLFVA